MLSAYKPDNEDAADGDSDGDELVDEDPQPEPIEWLGLRRREPSSIRGSRPNQFYAIFVHAADGTLHSIGDAIDDDVPRETVPVPKGTVALWPLKPDGTERLGGLTSDWLHRTRAHGGWRGQR